MTISVFRPPERPAGHGLVGGWQDGRFDTWPVGWPLVRALAIMYDDLLAVVRLRPGAVVVPSAAGAVQETYALLADTLRRN